MVVWQDELARLKEAVASLRQSVTAAACGVCHREICVCTQAAADRATAHRLRDERDALLQSGVYLPDDPVVQSLETRLAQLAGH